MVAVGRFSLAWAERNPLGCCGGLFGGAALPVPGALLRSEAPPVRPIGPFSDISAQHSEGKRRGGEGGAAWWCRGGRRWGPGPV